MQVFVFLTLQYRTFSEVSKIGNRFPAKSVYVKNEVDGRFKGCNLKYKGPQTLSSKPSFLLERNKALNPKP